MVTKLSLSTSRERASYILAKNHMVTKPDARLQRPELLLYSSKKPYGNKTSLIYIIAMLMLYSSKKPYGNKTGHSYIKRSNWLYSSKKPYGNKTIVIPEHCDNRLYSSKKPYGNKTNNIKIFRYR